MERVVHLLRRLSRLLLLLTIPVLAVCACTPAAPTVIGDPYTPPRHDPPVSVDGTPEVGWVEVGHRFYVTTWGSSSCPMAPTALVTEGRSLHVAMTGTGGPDCTADLTGTSYALDVPPGLRGTESLTVVLEMGRAGRFELALEA
ncbi:hypothetical protein DT076_07205 [Desertihabitans brevis]|uniref:DUF4232 domain-containing protein n=1 Tax=Desertihabitans brevis TaxID=2268447 RepID=A0A367YWZ7_9ACTN|nr:hypothetical protein [Desertihabitans brevis]RCK70423.1 hypothetical protein DT076_07205 [Desertihabitans brevis]